MPKGQRGARPEKHSRTIKVYLIAPPRGELAAKLTEGSQTEGPPQKA